MFGIRKRLLVGELMDSPELPPEDLVNALAALNWINRFGGTSKVLWREIAALAATSGSRPLKILDVATGGGGVPVELAKRARRANVPIQISGCDISRTAIRFASECAAKNQVEVDYFQLDANSQSLPEGYGIITCNLFLHHLSNEQIEQLIGKMTDVAGRMVLISDLVRDPIGFVIGYIGSRVLTRSRIIHIDGMRSLQAALTIPELAALANQAGLKNFEIRRHWPRRMLFKWNRA